MKTLSCWTALVCGILAVSPCITPALSIVGISTPIGSDDAQSRPRDDNVWSVSAPPFPFEVNSGIGFIINPNYSAAGSTLNPADFSRHEHIYSASNVPDATRTVVTYEFDSSTAVDQLEIIQHRNGITQIEGFVGDSLGLLVSIALIFGPNGDATGSNILTEYSSHVFDFNNTTARTFFQVVFQKTNEVNSWATYRAFPRLEDDTRSRPLRFRNRPPQF